MNKTQSFENDSLQIPCTYSVGAPLKILFCYDRKLSGLFFCLFSVFKSYPCV